MPLLQQYHAMSATMCWSSLLNTVPIISLAVVLCCSTQHHTFGLANRCLLVYLLGPNPTQAFACDPTSCHHVESGSNTCIVHAAGSIYITIGNSGYQGDWVATGALDCCSNITGTVHCGSSSGISVTATQNVTIGSESSYQYVFNISKPLDSSWTMMHCNTCTCCVHMKKKCRLRRIAVTQVWGCCSCSLLKQTTKSLASHS